MGIIEWKYWGDCSPSSTVTLPENWTEIYAVAYEKKDAHTSGTKIDFFIPRIHLKTINSYTSLCNGWAGTVALDNAWHGYASFRISETEISNYTFSKCGSTQSSASLKIYYR